MTLAQTMTDLVDRFGPSLVAREACVATARTEAVDRLSWEEMVDAVVVVTGVRWSDLRDGRRTKKVVQARSVLFWLAHEVVGMGYIEIAEYVNGRTHSTVVGAVRRGNEDAEIQALALRVVDRARTWRVNKSKGM